MSLDTFEWLPTECADERYPMQLIAGDLHCSNDAVVPVPDGKIINNGWGEVGSRRIIGETLKPVPQRLELAWFSYAEDQFFMGQLELPHAELTKQFVDGFEEPVTRSRVTWSKIIVGMGLGGWTSVWLAGEGIVREVASAQLEPREIDWTLVLDNPDLERSKFIRSTLAARLTRAELKTLTDHGPPVSTWPRYAQRHRWRIRVEGIQVPLYMFLRTFNGERRFYDFARQPPGELEGVPKQIEITWLSRNRRKLLSKIRFDEAEIFGVFEKLGLDTGSTLRIEYGPRSQVSVWIESRGGRVALAHTKVEVFSLAD